MRNGKVSRSSHLTEVSPGRHRDMPQAKISKFPLFRQDASNLCLTRNASKARNESLISCKLQENYNSLSWRAIITKVGLQRRFVERVAIDTLFAKDDSDVIVCRGLMQILLDRRKSSDTH
jgi:hypothetical protein